jgi:hypothetical protein
MIAPAKPVKESVVRLARAPFFVAGLLFSLVPVFFFFAWVSVASWCEDGLRRVGYRGRPAWLPAVLGIVGYAGLGIAGPAYLGHALIGWPGAILGPLLVLCSVAILGRW